MSVSECPRPDPDFRMLFQTSPGLYLVLDPAWNIVAATDAYLQATLTVRDEIIGRYIFDVFPDNPEDPAEESGRNMRASLHRATTERTSDTMALARHDVRRPGHDNVFEERYWSPTNTPVLADDGSLRYIMHRVENVTEFVLLQQSAARTQGPATDLAVDRLASEIVQRRAEVADASRQLKESNIELRGAQAAAAQANAAKNEFLSRMSHELRTPLNAVLGFAQLLELDLLSQSQEDAVGHILRGGKHLLAMINDLLDIAGIESDRLEISAEPVDVAELITESIGLMQIVAAANRIRIQFDPDHPAVPRFVRADRRRLKQVLLNLLSNAIKYNKPDGRVHIGVARGGSELSVAVTDTGIGIPTADLARLFTPFDRLGRQTSDIEGTGLGLALSRRLITVMGGRLAIESVSGHGSTFTMTMPLVDPPDPPLPARRPSRDVREAPAVLSNVLYIEDNPSNVALLRGVVHRLPGWTMTHAANGGRGLELAATCEPTVILLDVHLPDMNGIDVLKAVRADPMTADIPIAILSADANPSHLSRLLAAGAQAYLTKPVDISELLSFLDSHTR